MVLPRWAVPSGILRPDGTINSLVQPFGTVQAVTSGSVLAMVMASGYLPQIFVLNGGGYTPERIRCERVCIDLFDATPLAGGLSLATDGEIELPGISLGTTFSGTFQFNVGANLFGFAPVGPPTLLSANVGVVPSLSENPWLQTGITGPSEPLELSGSFPSFVGGFINPVIGNPSGVVERTAVPATDIPFSAGSTLSDGSVLTTVGIGLYATRLQSVAVGGSFRCPLQNPLLPGDVVRDWIDLRWDVYQRPGLASNYTSRAFRSTHDVSYELGAHELIVLAVGVVTSDGSSVQIACFPRSVTRLLS
jgi:hypothetical protein